jgi:hypothetical protein
MLETSTSTPPSDTGGLKLLFAFVSAALVVVLEIALEALAPSTAGAAVLVGLMLLMMVSLIALIMRMLADEAQVPPTTVALPGRSAPGATKSPGLARRPVAVLMGRRTSI